MAHSQSIELARLAHANAELARLRDDTDALLSNLRQLDAELTNGRRELVARCISTTGHIRFCAEQAQTFIGMSREKDVPTLDTLRLGDTPLAEHYNGD